MAVYYRSLLIFAILGSSIPPPPSWVENIRTWGSKPLPLKLLDPPLLLADIYMFMYNPMK